MDLDLGSILNQTAQVTSSMADLPGKIMGLTDDLTEIARQRTAASDAAASAAATKTTLDMQTAAEQEARRKAIAARFGTDSTSAGWIIGTSVDAMREAKAGADAANAKIRAKESVSFLDNPLGWLTGKATVGADYAEYNYWATQYNNAEKIAKDTESMTQQSFITSNALTSTVTQSYIDAAKILNMHQYVSEGLQSAAQGLRWNMDGITAAASLSKERLALFYQANSAIAQQKSQQIALEHLNLAKQQFNLQKAAQEEKVSEEQLTTNYIQKGYFNLTGRAMDTGRAKEALLLFKSKQPDIMMYFQNGLESASVGGKPVISLSPYDASTLHLTSKVQNVSPGQKVVLDQLVTWRREFESPAVQTSMQLDPKDKTAKERAFNTYVNQKIAQTTANVQQGSLFSPAPLAQVGSLNKNISMMPLWRNVIEPAAKSGVNVDDPNVLFGLVVNAMETGKIGYADATDLATVYQAGMELSNQTNNYLSVGLPSVRTFNTQVSLPDQIGKTTVNLADARELATRLNQVSAKAASKILNQRTGNPLGYN